MPNARNSFKGIEGGTVKIMLLKDKIVKIMGDKTHKQYIFNGAGSVVDVDDEDVEGIMSRNRRIASCCGSYSSPYFDYA